MAKVKNIEAYCNFCGAVTKMEVSRESEVNYDENKKWVKCKKCKQTMAMDIEEIEGSGKPKLKQIEDENSRTYTPKESFEVGETIFHQGWNDLGIVTEKEVLTSGQNAIVVEFQNNGQKKLIVTKAEKPAEPSDNGSPESEAKEEKPETGSGEKE